MLFVRACVVRAARGRGGSYARRARNCPQRAARGVGCGVGAIFSRLFCVIVQLRCSTRGCDEPRAALHRLRSMVPLARALRDSAGDRICFALRSLHKQARASVCSVERCLVTPRCYMPEPWLQRVLVLWSNYPDVLRGGRLPATATSARLQPLACSTRGLETDRGSCKTIPFLSRGFPQLFFAGFWILERPKAVADI